MTPAKVVERRPPPGHVYHIKYSFDNVIWSRFYASRAQETGMMMNFSDCRVEMPYTDSTTGAVVLYAAKTLDMRLDASKTKTFGYVAEIPEWYGRTEEDARKLCQKADGLDLLPDPYAHLAAA